MKPARSIQEKILDRLLLLYPPSLRRTHESQMLDLFRRRYQRRGRGFWRRLVRDILASWIEAAFPARSPRSAKRPEPGSRLVVLLDLRQGLRQAFRHKSSSLIAILVLATGIGVATYAFGVYHGTFRMGLAVAHPERIVHLTATNLPEGRPFVYLNPTDFRTISTSASLIEELAAYEEVSVHLAAPGQPPDHRRGLRSTASLFPLLEAPAPLLGRLLVDSDESPSASGAVLLSFNLWRNRFQEDADIVGTLLTINGALVNVVGVMPQGFSFPHPAVQFWLPLSRIQEKSQFLDVLGRLEAGASLAQAQAELDSLAAGLRESEPQGHEGFGLRARTFSQGFRTSTTMETQMRLTSWTGLLMLLIALANVANLLLLRGYSRVRELALRIALGAGRSRVLGQFLAESSAFAIAGGALGALLAAWGLSWYQSQWPEGYSWWRFALQGPTLAIMIAVSTLACLLVGLFPALHFLSMNLNGVLKDQARSNTGRFSRLGHVFVMLQIALGGSLLFVAALMVQSSFNQRWVDYGFAIDDVVTARVSLDEARYPDRESRQAFWKDLQGKARAIPGVEEATLATQLPMIRYRGLTRYALWGETYPPDGLPIAYRDVVTPEFFDAFEKRLIAGRGFNEADSATSEPVAIVNQDFVRLHFPDGQALGRRIRLAGPEAESDWMTVVGVAPHLWMDTDVNERPQGMYLPLTQDDQSSLSIALRVVGSPSDYVGPLRQRLFEIDPHLALSEVMTMEELIRSRMTVYRRTGPQFIAFGAAALLVAVVGLYAVVSYLTRTRTAEIGVRMALGADRRHVLGMVLRQGTWTVGLGAVLGIALALYLSQGLSRFLFELEPWDGRVLAASFLVLAGTALAAMAFPALRATRIDPARTLRSL